MLLTLLLACSEDCVPAPEGSLGDPTAWELEYLSAGQTIELPQYSDLTAEDGFALAHADWVPDGWDGTGSIVILAHGSSAHGALYAVLGSGLADRGVYARLLDIRGHGMSRCPDPADCDATQLPSYIDDGDYWPGRPGDALDEHQPVRDLLLQVTDLQERFPAASIVLAGHSSGGGLVSRAVELSGAPGAAGVALIAPFNHPDQPQVELGSWECGTIVGTAYAQVDLGALGDARRGNPHRYVISLNKPAEYQDALDTTQYTYTLNQGLAVTNPDTFHAAFTMPTLWVAGQKDAMLDLAKSEDEFGKMPGGVAFVEVEDTSHVGVTWSDGVAGILADFALDPEQVTSGIITP
ncbi:MAG: alpha-beta hydrolase superfamily lysophospholipase [Myxococcota bacterium]|jgi:alpha-beta hydrolase superfamily lysophospholipase